MAFYRKENLFQIYHLLSGWYLDTRRPADVAQGIAQNLRKLLFCCGYMIIFLVYRNRYDLFPHIAKDSGLRTQAEFIQHEYIQYYYSSGIHKYVNIG